jgi:hypothetical protein
VFPGARIATPGWLPPGYEPADEHGFVLGDGTVAWVQTWAAPRPDDTASECTPAGAAIEFAQGPARLLEEYGVASTGGSESTHRVRGNQATFSTDPGGQRGRLAWTEGDEGFVISSRPLCHGDTPLAEHDLVRFAEALDIPRPEGGAGR